MNKIDKQCYATYMLEPMTVKQYFKLGGKGTTLISALDNFFLQYDEAEGFDNTIECSNNTETYNILTLLKNHSSFPLGFDLNEYRDYKEWNRIYCYGGEIHFGTKLHSDALMLSDILKRCLVEDKIAVKTVDDLDVELPDVMDLLTA